MTDSFSVWAKHSLGGLPNIILWLSLVSFAGLISAKIVDAIQGDFPNRPPSLGPLLWVGITVSFVVGVSVPIWYRLFANQDALELKKNEINATTLTKIKEQENELDNIRCHGDTQPHGDDRKSAETEKEQIATESVSFVKDTSQEEQGRLEDQRRDEIAVFLASVGRDKRQAERPFSGLNAYLFFGLPVGLITGVMVAVVSNWVGGWFNEWWLVFQIPAKLMCAAIVAVITGVIAGVISGGLVGSVTAHVSTMPIGPQKPGPMVIGPLIGFIVGLIGGPICVFLGGTPGLITGGIVGILFGTCAASRGLSCKCD